MAHWATRCLGWHSYNACVKGDFRDTINPQDIFDQSVILGGRRHNGNAEFGAHEMQGLAQMPGVKKKNAIGVIVAIFPH